MSTSDKICNDGASKSNDDNDGVCEVNGMLQNMSTTEEDNNCTDISNTCANCGKEGSDMNKCNKCYSVMYCNAACKKKHRSKHKKACDKCVAEVYDEALFKQPPPQFEDCSICFLRMPSLASGRRYKSCCGKSICSGCAFAPVYDDQGNIIFKRKCPFCRTPAPKTDEEIIKRVTKQVEVGDTEAMNALGLYYGQGKYGLPQDYTKALELWMRASELGYATAYYIIGMVYDAGDDEVEIDKKKATHYFELAAMGGNAPARHHLGALEENAGNIDRAIKHYMISVRGGEADSLQKIQQLYKDGNATKDDYLEALRAYQEYLAEIKSVQRDNAAEASAEYRYY